MANGKRAESENYLASAEMSVESNYNSIDAIIKQRGSQALRAGSAASASDEPRKEMERTQTEQTRERPSREAR